MAVNFPSNPTGGDLYTYNNIVFTYDGEKWKAQAPVSSTTTYSDANVASYLSNFNYVTTATDSDSQTLSLAGNVITISGSNSNVDLTSALGNVSGGGGSYADSDVEAYLSGGDGIDFASGVVDVDSTVVRTIYNGQAQEVYGQKRFHNESTFYDYTNIFGPLWLGAKEGNPRKQPQINFGWTDGSSPFFNNGDKVGQQNYLIGSYNARDRSNVTNDMGSFYLEITNADTTSPARTETEFVFEVSDTSFSTHEALRIKQDGKISINEEYTLPNADGTAGQVLTTDGSGTLSFATPSSGGNQTLTLNGTAGQLAISGSGGNNVDLRQTQFLYSALSDLPSASTYHGAIAHVHAEGALYFAHSGSWNKLQNDIPNIANSAQGVNVTGRVATEGVDISAGGQLTAAGCTVDFGSATISFSGASVSGLNDEIRDVVEVGVAETFSTTNAASGVTSLDCNNGHIFYLTSPSADVTANFVNLYLNDDYATNLTVVVNQGATAREVTAIQIEGSGQTINWQGGSAPTGTANGIDVFSFTILRDNSTYIVLGQMVDFS